MLPGPKRESTVRSIRRASHSPWPSATTRRIVIWRSERTVTLSTVGGGVRRIRSSMLNPFSASVGLILWDLGKLLGAAEEVVVQLLEIAVKVSLAIELNSGHV
jgi:hypothetical protein